MGRLLLSPAHHQVHHSVDPKHHNRNMGSCLRSGLLFGTLYVPAREREVLKFGLGEEVKAPRRSRALFEPVYRTAEYVLPKRDENAVTTAAQRPAEAGR